MGPLAWRRWWSDKRITSWSISACDTAVIRSHSALRASRLGTPRKPSASFARGGSHRRRLGEAPKHTNWFDEVPRRRAQRRRKHDGLVTHESRCAGPISTEPLHPPSQGTRLRISGLKPLSFAYFSLRPAKKSRCPPHRGNANKPITKEPATAAGIHQ